MLFRDTKPENKITKGGLVFLFLLLLGTPPCFAMASRPKVATPSATTIKGQIKDSITNQTLANASVRIYSADGGIVASAISDNLGNYNIAIQDIRAFGVYAVSVFHKGYQRSYRNCAMKKGEEYRIDFLLELPKADIDDKQAPKIASVKPVDGAILYADEPVVITPVVNNVDLLSLTYSYIIDGREVHPLTSLASYSWKTTAADIGSHRITVKVKNGNGWDQKTIYIYLTRCPPFSPN